ncbi:MAG: WbqC family protein [Anaerolineales bacterium]|nr:WbqC family protein [Anaerolineales bacterium]
MKIAIMQPYFFPYIGYFQLINAVDEFVVYDNIKYTKKGWINRNRILVNGKVSYISLPLKKDSDHLDVRDRYLADIWSLERDKMLNRIIDSYRKAPHFDSVYPIIKKSILFEEHNLFGFILNSLNLVREYLGIQTPFLVSSTIPVDHGLKAEKKVVAICKARKADMYLNPIGGVQLYSKADFRNENIDLCFLKTTDFIYKQSNNEFISLLSIIDVMMFNSKEEIMKYLTSFYTIV